MRLQPPWVLLLLVSLTVSLVQDSDSDNPNVDDGFTWFLDDNIVGKDFFSAFNWNTFDDPVSFSFLSCLRSLLILFRLTEG